MAVASTPKLCNIAAEKQRHICDNDIVSQINGETSKLSSIERMAHLGDEHLYFDAL